MRCSIARVVGALKFQLCSPPSRRIADSPRFSLNHLGPRCIVAFGHIGDVTNHSMLLAVDSLMVRVQELGATSFWSSRSSQELPHDYVFCLAQTTRRLPGNRELMTGLCDQDLRELFEADKDHWRSLRNPLRGGRPAGIKRDSSPSSGVGRRFHLPRCCWLRR